MVVSDFKKEQQKEELERKVVIVLIGNRERLFTIPQRKKSIIFFEVAQNLFSD